MSGLYPSLEDMKVDQMARAQEQHKAQVVAQAQAITQAAHTGQEVPYSMSANPSAPSLYPSLEDYMGLSLTPEMIKETMPVVAANQNTQVATRGGASSMMIAPITGQNNAGLMRAEVKGGVREVYICKGADGKVGLRVRAVNKGVFVAFVHKDSPAALGGVRFGDQILQINGQDVAGWDTDKAMKALKNASPERITIALRDRPFERTITLQKDSSGHVGFVFKENKITAIVKDTSAARNGLLIDHHMVEVNGQNVVGLKESEIKQIFDTSDRTVTVTIIPSFIYDHIVKSVGSSLIKKYMDHSIPDV